ncbi:MAG: hypothetical protein R3F33_07690 [Planctomycetota bacterium]
MITRLTLAAALLAFSVACKSTEAPQQVKPYPLATCLVTGNDLGSMGDPYVFVYKGQEIKLCCEPCVDEFQADPDAFLAKLPK